MGGRPVRRGLLPFPKRLTQRRLKLCYVFSRAHVTSYIERCLSITIKLIQTMSSITLKNDRKRRRQARLITFIITAATLTAAAYTMGAADEALSLLQQLFHVAPTVEAAEPVASVI